MSKTEDLERRIEALVGTIEQERRDRKAESDAAAARIAELEARLNARNGATPAAKRPVSATPTK
eukprot:CAMPEP_0174867460 /NCGR_PEP_ID=MMETSP1114-20130205/64038_1 /TAXON_ID=312471 /ORGANISM="Neobodo designis, Strain CCAP 1951/1" /LENGTH=63 /DNA_ID=CAMNT_0016102649 /DNA_START=36 /DNA_END=224 /DNA_ORIENTATION=+